MVFLPFHYGSWDRDGDDGPSAHRDANELTTVTWDPASKQPHYKIGAVQVCKIADAEGPAPAPTTGASAPVDGSIPPTTGGPSAAAESRVVEG